MKTSQEILNSLRCPRCGQKVLVAERINGPGNPVAGDPGEWPVDCVSFGCDWWGTMKEAEPKAALEGEGSR
jgi:hypothetical protein